MSYLTEEELESWEQIHNTNLLMIAKERGKREALREVRQLKSEFKNTLH